MVREFNEAWLLESMTGVGTAHMHAFPCSIEVTIRSLNSRSFDLKCRLPDELSMMEQELSALISKRLVRGRVELAISVKNEGVIRRRLVLDQERAADLLSQLADFQQKNPKLNTQWSLGELLGAGMLICPNEHEQFPDDLPKLVIEAVQKALLELEKARKKEGSLLSPVLKEHLMSADALLASIKVRADSDIKKRHAALTSRIAELFSSLTLHEDRLYQECALLAQRSDFKEEIDRLSAHIEHFSSICQESASKGRRLDFLCQEMLREANTLLTKAFEHAVMTVAIELKAHVERMREQVQNIE